MTESMAAHNKTVPGSVDMDAPGALFVDTRAQYGV